MAKSAPGSRTLPGREAASFYNPDRCFPQPAFRATERATAGDNLGWRGSVTMPAMSGCR